MTNDGVDTEYINNYQDHQNDILCSIQRESTQSNGVDAIGDTFMYSMIEELQVPIGTC